MEAPLPFRGNVFFKKSNTRLVETDFLCSEKVFFIRTIFLLVKTIIGIREKQLLKKKRILASG